jgi:hypothetical protein
MDAVLHSLILQLRTDNSELSTSLSGGEGGIRTHGPITGTHAFQACRFDHSRTSPDRFSRGGILTRGLMTGKVMTSAHCHGTAPRFPFLYYKEIKRRRGDEDSYRTGHPGRPLGDNHHSLCIYIVLTRPDCFAASLWRNSSPTHQSVTHVSNNSLA